MKPSFYARINYRYALAYELLDFMGHFPDIGLKRFNKISVSPDDGLTLELGCGTGRSSRVFLAQGVQLVSLDINWNFVTYGKKKGRIEDGVAGSAYQLCFPDAIFDKVVVADAFHHLLDHDLLFKEVCRVLKPGGTFLIFDIVGEKDEKAPNRVVNHFCDGPVLLMGARTCRARIAELADTYGFQVSMFRTTPKEKTIMGIFGGIDAEAILIKN